MVLVLRSLPLLRENLLEPFVARQLALLVRRFFEQASDDRIGSDAFGGGREVRQDPMAQDGISKSLDVLALHVRAAVQQGSRLTAKDQVLHRPRTRTPRQPVLDELRNSRLAHPR